MDSRIKNPDLKHGMEEGLLEWMRYVMPITEHFCRQIEQRDYRGKRLVFWTHITANLIPMLMALKQSGAEILVGACNRQSTDDAAAAYLDANGITVVGWQGMSEEDYNRHFEIACEFRGDYLSDMGGEMTRSYIESKLPVHGALEATTTGLHTLRGLDIPFPVFDWNSMPLKDRIENRFHVADGLWPAFTAVTGLSLFGRRILVVGYGPVGKGVAERARDLGGTVYATDLDPVRLVEATFHGCQSVRLQEGLEAAEIIVTATGSQRVLREEHLRSMKPGTIVLNAGHSSEEIDVNWLYTQPHRDMVAHVERFDMGDTHIFLLARGHLLNLAAGVGLHGLDVFDHYTAVMLVGISWMFDGIPPEYRPGMQPFPKHLEQSVAQVAADLRWKRD